MVMELNCVFCQMVKKLVSSPPITWLKLEQILIESICNTCNVPIFIFTSHIPPSDEIFGKAIRYAYMRHPTYIVDLRKLSVPDHPHFHMRPRDKVPPETFDE